MQLTEAVIRLSVQFETFLKYGLLHGLTTLHALIPGLQVLKIIKANWRVLVGLEPRRLTWTCTGFVPVRCSC